MFKWSEEKRREHRERMRLYYLRNPSRIQAINKRSKAKHGHGWPSEQRVKRLEYERRYKAKRRLDPIKWERHLELMRQARKREHDRLKKEVLEAYGARCVCCGESILDLLTIDHINEDGGERRRRGQHGGLQFYRWIKKSGFPADLQAMCWNCNIGKHIYGECPHKRAKV